LVDSITLYDADRITTRRCGDCTLCCKLLPVRELHKRAGQRCEHQRTGKGCTIYERRPPSCMLWSCRWLIDDECTDLPRPDRAHYVLDMMPDFVTLKPHDGSAPRHLPVIQVWIDPAFPKAHEAASFRAWLDSQRTCALIRFNASDGFVLAPPSVTGDGWQQQGGEMRDKTHTLHEVVRALGRS
jgi:hypothetical protein